MTLSIKEFYGALPGFVLPGYLQRKRAFRILVFGKVRLSDLGDIDPQLSLKRLHGEIAESSLWVAFSRRLLPRPEAIKRSNALNRFLFKANRHVMPLLTRLVILLSDFFSPITPIYRVLLDSGGIGVFLIETKHLFAKELHQK